jgi:PAS domain S-box-containing protein
LSGPARAPDGPHGAALRAIAHDALLDHLNRSDARHALKLALDALAALLGCRCALQAQGADGIARWRIGEAAAFVRGPAAGWATLPLSRLDRPVGTLALESTLGSPELAQRLDPLLPALGALLLHDANAQPGTGAANLVAMIRAALEGAGTFVWEWDIESDRLGDIDRGLQELGYATDGAHATQEAWNRLIHPDDVDANDAAYQRHARGEAAVYEHAYRIRASDGSWRWYLERGRIVDRHGDGRPRRMVGIQADITERRADEDRVSQAVSRLERIARHVPGVLYQFEMLPDLSSRFSYVSERIRDLFGLDPAAITRDAGVMFGIIVPEDRQGVVDGVLASSRTLAEWRQEFRIRHADGQERWILGTSTPQLEGDGRVVWHGYLQDMTALRELETARREAAAAAAANRAKTDFLSRMSHELRTPLNAVLGFAQLLEIDRASPLDDVQRRRVRLIREAGEHLLVMIGDLLDLTRIESRSMALQAVPVPLHALAGESLQMVQAAADAAGVRLTLAPDTRQLAALADRTRLRQVLLNLLSNAVKYNRRGGSVEVDVDDGDAGTVTLRVRDSGAGILPEDLGRVFEPFQRGVHEGSRIEGTGIGLSVTRSLVQLMNGHIEVQSTPGAGSVFTVTLPAAHAP